MTTPRHGTNFIWVTWITGLLSGDKQCRWAAWYRAHFKYDKRPDGTFDSAAWTADHNALVQRRKSELITDGWEVTLEGQNSFKLKGRTALLSGKPDIIARRGGDIRVVDCKTGKRRYSDWFQVLIYILAYRRVKPEWEAISGEVCYQDDSIQVAQHELSMKREGEIFAMLRLVGADTPPPHVPSKHECSLCDIAACAKRLTESEEEPQAVAAEF